MLPADCELLRCVQLAGVCGKACERSCTLAARLDTLCCAYLQQVVIQISQNV